MEQWKEESTKWELTAKKDNGSSKKMCQPSWSFVFCWTLLLFYSNMVHKQWLKVWFLTSQMPVLSGRINFVSYSTTLSVTDLEQKTSALWSSTIKNPDKSSGALAHNLLAPHCTLCLLAPLPSFVCPLTHSCARGKVSDWMAALFVLFSVLL